MSLTSRPSPPLDKDGNSAPLLMDRGALSISSRGLDINERRTGPEVLVDAAASTQIQETIVSESTASNHRMRDTISRDLTSGESVRQAKLLGFFGQRLANHINIDHKNASLEDHSERSHESDGLLVFGGRNSGQQPGHGRPRMFRTSSMGIINDSRFPDSPVTESHRFSPPGFLGSPLNSRTPSPLERRRLVSTVGFGGPRTPSPRYIVDE